MNYTVQKGDWKALRLYIENPQIVEGNSFDWDYLEKEFLKNK